MAQLDTGFEIFLNWQTALFCLGIYFITYIVRTVIEATVKPVKVPGSTAYNLWRELFLPLGPFGTGVLFAMFAKHFPWPMPVTDSLSVKVMYGLVCGGASGWSYARFRAWAKIKADAKLGPSSTQEPEVGEPEAIPVAVSDNDKPPTP